MSGRHALIVGGGIGGLVAALALAREGHLVEVFEQARDLGEIGAGIQLSPNCTRVLHHLGLEDALRAVAFLPEATEMRHWRRGHVIASNPLGAGLVDRYGVPYYHVHRADLIALLADAVRGNERIELHTGSRVDSVDQTRDGVTLRADDVVHSGDLLLGADGIHSVVRAALFGDAAPEFTGNVAWRALVPADALPAGRVRPVATVWWGPHRHFVHYYVRRGELVNCVCVVEKQGWQVESWTERGEHAELRRDFAGWHPDIEFLIDRIDPDSCYRWALFDRPPMSAWSRGRITLLGDACHPTLPFMAQGAAMAIEDAAVLARCVTAAGEDIPGALARYETLRIPRTAGIQSGSRRNATVFHLTGPAAWVRNRAARRASGASLDRLFRYDALAAADEA